MTERIYPVEQGHIYQAGVDLQSGSVLSKLYALPETERDLARFKPLVAKVYKRENDPSIGVDFSDPEECRWVMEHEIDVSNVLSDEYGGAIGMVRLHDGSTAETILMRRVYDTPDEGFLKPAILRGESAKITDQFLTNLAQRVVNFHLNVAQKASVGSMTEFLKDIMNDERKYLLPQHEDNTLLQLAITQWDERIQHYLSNHAETLDEGAQLMGDPIHGHGDLETGNIALLTGHKVMIADAVPKEKWAINPKYTDMAFLITELELYGLHDKAELVKTVYLTGLMEPTQSSHLNDVDRTIIARYMDAIVPISEIYRLTNFARLGKIRKEPQIAQAAIQGLYHAYSRLE